MLAMWNASTLFLLDLVVVDDRVLAGEHLGHRVGEVDWPPRADVGLDDARLAALAGDDQRARWIMTCARSAADTNRIWIGCSRTAPSGM